MLYVISIFSKDINKAIAITVTIDIHSDMIISAEKTAITIHTLLYILQKIGGEGDYHKVFKILYFADQKHLAKYGSPITIDRYIAMKNGPVPSLAYDILKALRLDGPLSGSHDEFIPYFQSVNNHTVKALKAPDLDYLSESEIQCLDESIKAFRALSFSARTNKSHDRAYENTVRNGAMNELDIASAGGAKEGMIAYIKERMENETASFE